MKFQFVALLLSASLVGCTMITKKDCEQGDWEQIGLKAGKRGESKEHYAKVEIKCSQYGILSNKDQYNKGRRAGLKLFCTYESGRQFGYMNNAYSAACPEKLERDFLRGYNLGKSEYLRDEQEKALAKQREKQEAELRRMREEQEAELQRMHA